MNVVGERGCNSGGNLGASPHGDVNEERLFVYLIDAWKERAMLGGRRKLVCKGAWTTVRELKAQIERLLHIPARRQRLYWRSSELLDHRTLEESGVHKTGSTLLFDARAEGEVPGGGQMMPLDNEGVSSLEPVSCAALHRRYGGELPPALGRAVLKVRRALVVGAKAPTLAMDGTGGTYFMHDLNGRVVGCFKPADEEPFCVNNPRHFVGPHRSRSGSMSTISFSPTSRSSGNLSRPVLSSSWSVPSAIADEQVEMRHGVRPGEAHAREVAAYLLDCSSKGLAGVPETTLAEARHPKFCYADRAVREKLGSFQVYVPHDGVAEDYGPDSFDPSRLQAIAVLDMRALNCDRNAANLLVRRGTKGGKLHLVPIDHGYILPDVLEIEWFDWCWIDWPALRGPLCDSVKKHVLDLDPAADAAMLRDTLGMKPGSLRLMRAATELLKRGVNAGLSLRDVASLMVPSRRDSERNKKKGASALARLRIAVNHARELADLTLVEERRGPRRFPLRPRAVTYDNDAKEVTSAAAAATSTTLSAALRISIVDKGLPQPLNHSPSEEKKGSPLGTATLPSEKQHSPKKKSGLHLSLYADNNNNEDNNLGLLAAIARGQEADANARRPSRYSRWGDVTPQDSFDDDDDDDDDDDNESLTSTHESEEHGGSPRWVDGLPWTVNDDDESTQLLGASADYDESSASSVSPDSLLLSSLPRSAASHDDVTAAFDDDDEDEGVARYLATRRAAGDDTVGLKAPKFAASPRRYYEAPPPPEPAAARQCVSVQRSLEGSPLVRMHSCPSLADVGGTFAALDLNGNNTTTSYDPPSREAAPKQQQQQQQQQQLLAKQQQQQQLLLLAKRTAEEDAAYEDRFFHFLDGLLEDLVRWKLTTVESRRKAKKEHEPLKARLNRSEGLGLHDTLSSSSSLASFTKAN